MFLIFVLAIFAAVFLAGSRKTCPHYVRVKTASQPLCDGIYKRLDKKWAGNWAYAKSAHFFIYKVAGNVVQWHIGSPALPFISSVGDATSIQPWEAGWPIDVTVDCL